MRLGVGIAGVNRGGPDADEAEAGEEAVSVLAGVRRCCAMS